MAVNLQKGQKVSLTKEAPGGLDAIIVGCGWDPRNTDGADFDLDAMCFLLTSDAMVANDADFVYYGNMEGGEGSVKHLGDNLTGEGEGDDEQIMIALNQLPEAVDKITIAVNIYDAEKRSQNFGQVDNAFIRIVNVADNNELARFDLSEDFDVETAVMFGQLYRHKGEWKFKAMGDGWKDGLPALCQHHGVNA